MPGLRGLADSSYINPSGLPVLTTFNPSPYQMPSGFSPSGTLVNTAVVAGPSAAPATSPAPDYTSLLTSISSGINALLKNGQTSSAPLTTSSALSPLPLGPTVSNPKLNLPQPPSGNVQIDAPGSASSMLTYRDPSNYVDPSMRGAVWRGGYGSVLFDSTTGNAYYKLTTPNGNTVSWYDPSSGTFSNENFIKNSLGGVPVYWQGMRGTPGTTDTTPISFFEGPSAAPNPVRANPMPGPYPMPTPVKPSTPPVPKLNPATGMYEIQFPSGAVAMGPTPDLAMLSYRAGGGLSDAPIQTVSAASLVQAREAAAQEMALEQAAIRRALPPGFGANRRNAFYSGLEDIPMPENSGLFALHHSDHLMAGYAKDEKGIGASAEDVFSAFVQGAKSSGVNGGAFVGLLPTSVQAMIERVQAAERSAGQNPIIKVLYSGAKSAVAKARQKTPSPARPGQQEKVDHAVSTSLTGKDHSGINISTALGIGAIGLVGLWMIVRRK